MYELGSFQELKVINIAGPGAFLNLAKSKGKQEDILLPRKETYGLQVGDLVSVFVCRDSDDRLIATRKKPMLTLGQIAKLEVVDVGKIGAFLKWGLDKDLFLPFSEQVFRVKLGQEVLVALYLDHSNRLCATMNIRPYLRTDSPYKENDWVKATIYSLSQDFGAFLAVENAYEGRIPPSELVGAYALGETLECRVAKVKTDGKLDLTLRGRSYQEIDKDARTIYEALQSNHGFLPVGDKSDPAEIRRFFGMSKAAFKRAVGRLLKRRMIRFKSGGIELTDSRKNRRKDDPR